MSFCARLLFVFFAAFSGLLYSAQSLALSPGDIAIIGVRADDLDAIIGNGNDDAIAWVPLVDLAAGAEIFITDAGWTAANAFRTQEGAIKYTAPAGGLTAGTVMLLEFSKDGAGNHTITASGGGGTYTDANNEIMPVTIFGVQPATPGDNVFIFEGSGAAPNFIWSWKNDGPYEADSTSNSTTTLPSTLTEGTNALTIELTESGSDVSRYIGPTSGTAAQLASAIANRSNWELADNFPFPSGGNDITNGITTVSVTTLDSTPPIITCPADVTTSTDPGLSTAVVTFAVNATDNVGIASIVSNPASGTAFGLGTTTVNSTATDTSGNTANCSFDVTVNDTENPVATCPADVSVQAPIGQTTAIVTFSIIGNDNAPGVSITSTPLSGAAFPAGSTEVTGTVTDGAGNTDQCTFNVNVDLIGRVTLIKNVVNDSGGTAGANEFGLTIASSPVDSGSSETFNVPADVVINESGMAGYQFVGITGDAECPTTLGGTISLTGGEDITCTITNDDIAPTVTLTKNIIDNTNGTATLNDFGLSIGGTPVNSGDTLEVSAGVPVALNETGATNYQFVDITGDSGCPAVLGGTVSLSLDEDISCIINNTIVNAAPVINSASTAAAPENQSSAIDVQASDDYDTEGPGGGLTFAIVGGTDASFFTIVGDTGVVTFNNPPDFETPLSFDGDNDYSLKVSVTDENSASTEQDIVITVENVLDGTTTNLSASQNNSGFVTVNGTNQPNHFVITGTGPDSIEITDGANDGAPVGVFNGIIGMAIKAKQGANQITLIAVAISNSLNINSGPGSDVLEITDSLNVGGSLGVDLSGGDNMIIASDNNTTIDVGLNASFETTSGEDKIILPNIQTGNHLDIDTGSSNDDISLGVVGSIFIVGNRMTINAGSGDNNVTLIEGLFVNGGQLFSGSGMDDYTIDNSSGGFLDLLAGGGNDGVMSESNNFSGRYRTNCGPGTDTLISTNDVANPLTSWQCEILP